MRVRDGPAAVRGDAPPPRSHWRKPGRRRGREPRVRRPAALPITQNPSRKGGFRCFARLSSSPVRRWPLWLLAVAGASGGARALRLRSRSRRRLQRQGDRHEAAEPHRLALADGDRDALRDRRRRRRSSRSTTSPTTRRARRKTSLSGFTPNVEAIAAYRPDLVVIAYDPKGLSERARAARDHRPPPGRREVVQGRVPADPPARHGHRPRRPGGEARRRDEGEDRRDRRRRAEGSGRASPSTTSSTPDLYSATSKTFVGQVYTALGLENIADAADSAGFGYPQLSAEYVVSSSPDVIVLADTVCCGQKASTVAARPGWDRISAVRTGSIVRIHDSIASRWGPRLVELLPRDVVGARSPSPVAHDVRRGARPGRPGARADARSGRAPQSRSCSCRSRSASSPARSISAWAPCSSPPAPVSTSRASRPRCRRPRRRSSGRSAFRA